MAALVAGGRRGVMVALVVVVRRLMMVVALVVMALVVVALVVVVVMMPVVLGVFSFGGVVVDREAGIAGAHSRARGGGYLTAAYARRPTGDQEREHPNGDNPRRNEPAPPAPRTARTIPPNHRFVVHWQRQRGDGWDIPPRAAARQQDDRRLGGAVSQTRERAHL